MKKIIYAILFLTVVSCTTENKKEIIPNPVSHIRLEKQESEEEQQAELESEEDSDLFVSNEQFQLSRMRLGTLQTKLFSQEVNATGLIEIPKNNSASISTLMSGKVSGLNLIPGQYVQQGEQLFRVQNIDLIDLQQDYLELAQSIHFLSEEYKRNKILAEENINTQTSKLKAEAEYLQAMARKKGLEEQLKLLGISTEKVLAQEFQSAFIVYAPISGYVNNIYVNDGATIMPTDDVLDMYSLSKMHLELQVFEKDIKHLKKGMTIYYSLPEFSDKKYSAKIHFLGNMINNDSRTLPVHADIITRPERLIAGSYINANVIVASKNMRALPEAGVVEDDERFYVFALDKQTSNGYLFQQVLVKGVEVGTNGYTAVEFLEELPKDTQFLIDGAYYLLGEE